MHEFIPCLSSWVSVTSLRMAFFFEFYQFGLKFSGVLFFLLLFCFFTKAGFKMEFKPKCCLCSVHSVYSIVVSFVQTVIFYFFIFALITQEFLFLITG